MTVFATTVSDHTPTPVEGSSWTHEEDAALTMIVQKSGLLEVLAAHPSAARGRVDAIFEKASNACGGNRSPEACRRRWLQALAKQWQSLQGEIVKQDTPEVKSPLSSHKCPRTRSALANESASQLPRKRARARLQDRLPHASSAKRTLEENLRSDDTIRTLEDGWRGSTVSRLGPNSKRLVAIRFGVHKSAGPAPRFGAIFRALNAKLALNTV